MRHKCDDIIKTCIGCSEDFAVLTSTEKSRIKERGIGVQYCSLGCYNKSKKHKNTRSCAYCGRDVLRKDSDIDRTSMSFCNTECTIAYRRNNGTRTGDVVGDGSHTWLENGYVVVYNGTKNGIKLHRKVMEDYLGRELLPSEVVHHIDMDKTNNSIDNLQIMTHGKHSALHRNIEFANGKSFGCHI